MKNYRNFSNNKIIVLFIPVPHRYFSYMVHHCCTHISRNDEPLQTSELYAAQEGVVSRTKPTVPDSLLLEDVHPLQLAAGTLVRASPVQAAANT